MQTIQRDLRRSEGAMIHTMGRMLLGMLLALSFSVSADTGNLVEWLSLKRMNEVEPVANTRYAQECSACHFAYPPGLLTARSWRKLLAATALANHFGDNAELAEAARQEIEAYAVAKAADRSNYKRSRKIAAATPADSAPLRITENSYIKHKHAHIPAELIAGNPQVGSLSNCNACHTGAAAGQFDDDAVFINGYGRWDH
ncbi:MAG TPA: diheme cytochrome c [Gammaproteobacteria bacterium]